MIIIIIGGIGSGKSLTAAKFIKDNKQYCYTNFQLKGIREYHRIKLSEIVREPEEGEKVKADNDNVNWDFWNAEMEKHKDFSIYLDEIHISALGARNFMTKTNKTMTAWISQIRKLTYDSDRCNLYLISQQYRKIDIDARELAQVVIECQGYHLGKNFVVILKYYDGSDAYEKGVCAFKTAYVGNPYFKYYERLEIIRFGRSEYL